MNSTDLLRYRLENIKFPLSHLNCHIILMNSNEELNVSSMTLSYLHKIKFCEANSLNFK